MSEHPTDRAYRTHWRRAQRELERITRAAGIMRVALARRPAPIAPFADALASCANDLQAAAEHAHDCAALAPAPIDDQAERAHVLELLAAAGAAKRGGTFAAAACLYAAAAGMIGESSDQPGRLLRQAKACQQRASRTYRSADR